MKKLSILAFVAALGVLFVGCGDDKPKEATSTEAPATEATPAPEASTEAPAETKTEEAK